MYQHILVATDGTELGQGAVVAAAKLAKVLNARLTIVTVTEPPPSFSSAELSWSVPSDIYEQFRQADAQQAGAILKAAAAAALEQGCASAIIHLANQMPYAGILAAAQDNAVELIVMASHGHRGLDRLLLGSQTAKVLSLATVPVLVVK